MLLATPYLQFSCTHHTFILFAWHGTLLYYILCVQIFFPCMFDKLEMLRRPLRSFILERWLLLQSVMITCVKVFLEKMMCVIGHCSDILFLYIFLLCEFIWVICWGFCCAHTHCVNSTVQLRFTQSLFILGVYSWKNHRSRSVWIMARITWACGGHSICKFLSVYFDENKRVGVHFPTSTTTTVA